MKASAFAQRLVKSGALLPATLAKAVQRQRLYGGGLDTVLLEMGALDEPTLWDALVAATGLSPLPPALLGPPVVQPELLFDTDTARALGALVFLAPSQDGEPTAGDGARVV